MARRIGTGKRGGLIPARNRQGKQIIKILTKTGRALKGASAMLVLSISTVTLTTLAFILALFKPLVPKGPVRDGFHKLLSRIAELWIGINNRYLSMYRNLEWNFELPDGLSREGCYLVNCNHQTWLDIIVLQRCFNRKLPLLRFFIKSQLIWVPFLGMAWWAMDFPFMRRYSREQIAKQPGLKGKDLDNARKACEKFKSIPVAMMTFAEGTRFSHAKRDRYKSPYQNLLMPRIGGIGQTLFALGSELDCLIDVTIVYPQMDKDGNAPDVWELISGQVTEVIVRAQRVEIPDHLRGRSFRTDRNFRKDLEAWVNGMWSRKDQQITDILAEAERP